MSIFQEECQILSNIEIALGKWRMVLKAPQITATAEPGQFVHLKCNHQSGILLRRPFSIHQKLNEEDFSLIFEVVGKGTNILSQRKEGESLDVLGPLGRGFEIIHEANNIALVAGGMGIAPFLFLWQRLYEDLNFENKEIYLFYGAKEGKSLVCLDEFKKFDLHIFISTEDGSLGEKGKISDLFEKKLSSFKKKPEIIYCCGPFEMMKKIGKFSIENRIRCFVSLEQNLACGLGACLGCVVLTRQGYQRVCKDGPIFEAKDIIWNGKT